MKFQGIATNDRLVQAKGHIVSNMGDEKVMLSVRNGKYYNLGMVGGRVWELMETPITKKRINRSVARRI
ncbi:lasso peptide biosynthesis PqqD family chaperone [Cohnella kolymensis]|uniref:lasso peptide biosynthesis PqqD family chaperone n=1 Tax=Cohnella kolymensis TaxID=1590652 RepID=UPI000B1C5287